MSQRRRYYIKSEVDVMLRQLREEVAYLRRLIISEPPEPDADELTAENIKLLVDVRESENKESEKTEDSSDSDWGEWIIRAKSCKNQEETGQKTKTEATDVD